MIDSLPANIIDRLRFLHDENLTSMNREEIETLEYIYAFFLKMYHQMQYENFTTGATEFTVDSATLTDIKHMLDHLSTSFTDRLIK